MSSRTSNQTSKPGGAAMKACRKATSPRSRRSPSGAPPQHPGDHLGQEALVPGVGQVVKKVFELVEGGPGEPVGDLLGIVDGAVVLHPLDHPAQRRSDALLAGRGEEGGDALMFLRGRVREEMDQYQSALSLEEVVSEFFAKALIADQIEHVIADLEGGANKEPEADQGLELGEHVAAANQGAQAHRRNGCAPAGFFENHLEIVSVG